MTLRAKMFHSLSLSILFTLINWFIVDNFILKVSIMKYVLIELLLVASLKLFNFTKIKLGLN